MLDIYQIAEKAGIKKEYVIPYGLDKAKIDLRINEELKDKKNGKLVLVTAITPTKAGEGKTTTSIALHDGLHYIGVNSMLCLREPSLGPVFGLKVARLVEERLVLSLAKILIFISQVICML